MTRVEKYAEYRKEIEKSFRNVTTKEQSASMVDKIIQENHMTSNNINYDDVMEAYEIYDHDENEEKKKSQINKRNVLFGMIYAIIIIALLAALIIVGIKAFGGN